MDPLNQSEKTSVELGLVELSDKDRAESPLLLRVRDLCVEFKIGGELLKAVNNVSFDVRMGEVVAIVGESGSGKSTTMLAVMGLLPKSTANVSASKLSLDEIDLLSQSDNAMRLIRGERVSMVFQDALTSLNPALRIGYQISEPLIAHKGFSRSAARRRAFELLQLVGISDPERRLDEYPHEFSGGMRQRVMIAIALACDPKLLVADEPTTALDVTTQAQILELVRELRQRLGMSMVWITHDLAVVAGMADRVNVMYAGRIVEACSVDELFETPRHPYTEALLESLPNASEPGNKIKSSIQGSAPDLRYLPSGCPFSNRCRYSMHSCEVSRPELREVRPEHSVACWLDISKQPPVEIG